jgi:hypothetical protein
MASRSLQAELREGEAVLAFPYDERLRLLLRAVPGRRWDPERRVWRVPLGPEQADAVARLLAGVAGEAQVSAGLARRLRRLRRRRARDRCVLDLVRPGAEWALGFATDGRPDTVQALLAHPGARTLPAIGRAVLPLDEPAARLVFALAQRPGAVTVTETARRALRRVVAPVEAGESPAERRRREAELRAGDAERGRRGGQAGTGWRGTVEAGGARGTPELLLLGDRALLPSELRERSLPAAEGASVALTADSARLVAELDAWITPAAGRCLEAVAAGRPAPPAVLELSRVHTPPAFVLAPGHDRACTESFAALPGVLAPLARAGRPRRRAMPGPLGGAPAGEHARLTALRVDPFCMPALDRFLEEHGVWVEPAALGVLQEIREEHARAAGLVELSAADSGDLRVPRLGGELKPFQRAGVAYLLDRRRAFLADEQGLGKTIQALAAIEADEAFPAVVVCPAS